MTAHPFHSFLRCGLAAGGLFALATAASAEPATNCARYGADYVAVSGSNGCVRIGGHVRVEISRGPAQPMGYAALDGVQRASATHSARMAPIAPFGLNDLFPR